MKLQHKTNDLADLGWTEPPSAEEYRNAGLTLARLAQQQDALSELSRLLEMIGYPNAPVTDSTH